MRCNAVNFCGIQKPYKDNNNRTIIPIAKNPSKSEVDKIIGLTKTSQKPQEGYNGSAFLQQYYVVKKYKGSEAFSDDPFREINMLDNMYDSKLKFNNSQEGLFAVCDKKDTYLVSTRVEGQNPDFNKAPFNKKNLESLVGIISQMDRGTIIPDSSNNADLGHCDRVRFMNYDFNGKNINVTSDKAGLFDFEYSVLENIDDMVQKTIINKNTGANCHQSDTSGLPSSLRSFEFYTFCEYLNNAYNTKELFNDYLDIKGKYHKTMSEFYEEFSKESAYPEEMKKIALRESAHSELLSKEKDGNIARDILISEAKKIQMAYFMHEQSQFCDTGKINPAQLKEYTKETIEFFETNLNKAINKNDSNRIVYYSDCLELFSSWKNVNLSLEKKIVDQDPAILKKLSTDYAQTLDEKLI